MDQRADLWVGCRAAGCPREPAPGVVRSAELVSADLGSLLAAGGDRPLQASDAVAGVGSIRGFLGRRRGGPPDRRAGSRPVGRAAGAGLRRLVGIAAGADRPLDTRRIEPRLRRRAISQSRRWI